MNKYRNIIITSILSFLLIVMSATVAYARPPILLGPLGETVSNQPILSWQDYEANRALVEIATSPDIDPIGGWFTDPNKIKKMVSSLQFFDLKAYGIVLAPGTYWWQVQGYYDYPNPYPGVAWSTVGSFTVAGSTPPPPPPPAPIKKRVATTYHKYTCKYVKGWHAKHCKKTKNKKQSKKNKKFHSKKCSKVIIIG